VHARADGRGIVWPPAKTVYALRACIALAHARAGSRMKTGDIAQATDVPRGFLSKILSELRAAGIVSAKRGYNGGYRLTRPPGDIRVDELLRAVGTRDPFASLPTGDEKDLPFIAQLRNRLHCVAVEALESASLAEPATEGAALPGTLGTDGPPSID
jgi:Rrf2 family protein